MDEEQKPLLEQLIYISKSVGLMSDKQLIRLLNQSRINNMDLDVTGMLAYNEGTFLQILEGPASSLDPLFLKIKNDPRHMDCAILMRQAITHRAFEGWSMGFRSGSNPSVEKLIGYIDIADDSYLPSQGHSIFKLLGSFRS